MSHSKVTWAILAALLSTASTVSVAGTAQADPPCAPPAEAAVASGASGARRPAGLLEESIARLTLRSDQRAKIATIAASIGPSRLATREARAALLDALATEIDAGRVDAAALRQKVLAAVNAEASERATERAALEQLHGILEHDQRAELSRLMESRLVAWQPRETRAGELRRISTELKLSRAQRTKVAAVLRVEPIPHDVAPRAAKAEEQRIAEAFKADDFVMEHVVRDDTRATSAARLERFLVVAERVSEILGPEQRRLCADKMRARARAGILGL